MSANQMFGHIWWQISLPYILVGMVWAYLLHLTSGEAPTDFLFAMIAAAGGIVWGISYKAALQMITNFVFMAAGLILSY